MKVIMPQRFNVIEAYTKDGGYLTGHYQGMLCYFKDAAAIINGLNIALKEANRELSRYKKKDRKNV